MGYRAHECGAEVEDEVGDEICVDDPLEDRPARAEGNIDLEAHTVRNLRSRHASTLGQAASNGNTQLARARRGSGWQEQPEGRGRRTENET